MLLPLGEAPDKAWVRAEADRLGLGVADKPDSYDICFIPDGDTQGFLRARLGSTPGQIIDADGAVVGEHDGYWNFTVGQRRGLHLGNPAADGRPRYVIETRPESNQVVVGAAELLSVDRILCEDIIWLAGDDQGEDTHDLFVQVRAHGTPVPVAECTHEGSGLRVDLAQSLRGVAAGQSLVVYRGTRVLGEGTIVKAMRR